MTYERHDASTTTQSGVRHTAPNVDRVMGLGSSQETTVDRLLTVVERLTAELATTQSALHDLALEVARAGIGSGRAGATPSPGSGTGVSPAPAGTAPLASGHPSSLPPRRADHAVIPEIDRYVPGGSHDGASAPPPAVDGNRAIPPAPTVASDDGLAPAGPEVALSPDGASPAAAAAPPGFDSAADPSASRTDMVASLNDVQLLSAGAVDVMVGPVRSLADLDALEGRIRALHGVEAVTVMAFEGRDVLVRIEIERPLPLASMLRTELGRPVEGCRLVEGRIVVAFANTEVAT